MHTTSTLRGVFPETKPAYRRNFIKENVKSIKQLQGLLQEAGIPKSKGSNMEKFHNVPSFHKTRDATPQRQQMNHLNKNSKSPTRKTISLGLKLKAEDKAEIPDVNTDSTHQSGQKVTHRSVQTERTDDINKLFETGVIKYPSAGLAKLRESPNLKDHGDDLDRDIQNLELDEKDFIKENMRGFKPRAVKQLLTKVPAEAPPTYQRGVVPKYIRDRKQDKVEDEEEPCPVGHVLLPEEERKETLRVLRQSYADRIQELNCLPVRSDTLRIKKRKMEIEEELKRIDGGIKVFQRPKVYVKVDA
nr:uncharacterized protein LOC111513891 [Leptinotarsa decemlineata]XP_023025880.1 uncharacterized protein LOC111513891 [Leptinotarsa decemlineata]